LHIAVGHAGQTKIENLGLAVLLHQNIACGTVCVAGSSIPSGFGLLRQ
jgi:hypothetical protein